MLVVLTEQQTIKSDLNKTFPLKSSVWNVAYYDEHFHYPGQQKNPVKQSFFVGATCCLANLHLGKFKVVSRTLCHDKTLLFDNRLFLIINLGKLNGQCLSAF
jgi:hypothetical protein